jgi:hypothetical protein
MTKREIELSTALGDAIDMLNDYNKYDARIDQLDAVYAGTDNQKETQK